LYTRERMPTGATLTVDDDGAADFRTIQGALGHDAHLHRAAGETGLLYLRGKDNVTLQGASRDGVVVTARKNYSINPGASEGRPADSPGTAGRRAVLLIEDVDLLHLGSLTLVNDAWNADPAAEHSETINFASNGRLIATNASFFNKQDTIRVEGYSWFYRSLIVRNVDFIWARITRRCSRKTRSGPLPIPKARLRRAAAPALIGKPAAQVHAAARV
jgi:hypothetical protein